MLESSCAEQIRLVKGMDKNTSEGVVYRYSGVSGTKMFAPDPSPVIYEVGPPYLVFRVQVNALSRSSNRF